MYSERPDPITHIKWSERPLTEPGSSRIALSMLIGKDAPDYVVLPSHDRAYRLLIFKPIDSDSSLLGPEHLSLLAATLVLCYLPTHHYSVSSRKNHGGRESSG